MATAPEGFDLADPVVQQDPHPHYEAMRPDGVLHVERSDAYLILRHEDILQVLHDPTTFSSKLGSNRAAPRGDPGRGRAHHLRRAPAPSHPARQRPADAQPLPSSRLPGVHPAKMDQLRPFVVELADDLIDGWSDPSSVEFVEDFAVPLPTRVIAHALNIPVDRQADFKRWSDANTATIGATVSPEEFVENTKAIVEMQHFFVEQFEQRRLDPQDDLLTTLLQSHIGAEDDGSDSEPLDMPELVRIVQQLLVAGNETTTKLLAETIRLIADTPGEWDRIRADPSTIPAVVEEGLRISSPNQGMSRVATRDAVIGGVEIPEGSRVVVMFASANRDEEIFSCPHEYQPERERLPRTHRLRPRHPLLRRRQPRPTRGQRRPRGAGSHGCSRSDSTTTTPTSTCRASCCAG